MQIPDVSNWTHQIDASTAECFIYTFKDSMLSTVAHDLKLCVEEFEVAIDEPTRSVAAIFDTRSIHVVHAMRDGVELPQLLSEENKREIDLQIRISVLDTRTYPEILFVSKAVTPSDNGGYVVRGQLELCGVTREIVFPVRRESGAYVAEANVYQPDFGITPYSGLMGTMRIRPGVLVRLTIPAPWGKAAKSVARRASRSRQPPLGSSSVIRGLVSRLRRRGLGMSGHRPANFLRLEPSR